MTDDERERDNQPDTRSSRWFRREAIILAVALAIGFVLVPAMIYQVGIQVFGPTEDSASLKGFYGRFLEALMESDPIVWSLALAPYLLFIWLRLLRLPLRRDTA